MHSYEGIITETHYRKLILLSKLAIKASEIGFETVREGLE